jgi:hypothetical protein
LRPTFPTPGGREREREREEEREREREGEREIEATKDREGNDWRRRERNQILSEIA